MDPNPSLRWQEAEQLTAQGDEVRARPLYLALTEDRALAPYAHLRLGVFAQRDGDPRARYAIIEDGVATLKQVEYDVEETVTPAPRETSARFSPAASRTSSSPSEKI